MVAEIWHNGDAFLSVPPPTLSKFTVPLKREIPSIFLKCEKIETRPQVKGSSCLSP